MIMMAQHLDTKPLADLLGGHGTLTLTSSGAEATTQVLMSHYFDEARLQGKNQFVTKETFLEEFSCVVRPDLVITPRTALVSIALADPMSGVIQPVQEIAALCQQKEVALHVDVTEALGVMEIALDADFISCDGSALGVIGIGALLARKPLRPLIYGPRAHNPALVTQFIQAAQTADPLAGLEIARLRKRFEKALGETVLFAEQPRLPHISYIAFAGVHPEALAFRLRYRGLEVREGPLGVSFTMSPLILDAVPLIKEEIAILRTIAGDLL